MVAVLISAPCFPHKFSLLFKIVHWWFVNSPRGAESSHWCVCMPGIAVFCRESGNLKRHVVCEFGGGT